MDDKLYDYDLDSLLVTFKKHSEKYCKDSLEKGQKIDFNICEALLSICKEIKNLKNEN